MHAIHHPHAPRRTWTSADPPDLDTVERLTQRARETRRRLKRRRTEKIIRATLRSAE